MTIREFYAAADSDYETALAGLGKEERIIKYVRKLPGTQMPQKIREALDAKDYETAFREAHNLKGICLNIALKKLGEYSSELTESLRNGPTDNVEAFYELTDSEYNRVCSLIEQID